MNQEKIEQSLRVIEEANIGATAAGTPLLVNFSGGKDSSCVLLLAKKITDNVELIYMTSGIELPGSVEFVKEEAKRLNLKLHITDPVVDYKGDFFYWVKRYGYFPTCGCTFCSSRLKLRPSRSYLRKIFGRKHMYRLNGVRKSESSRRTKMYKEIPAIRPDRDLCGSFIVQPIQEWTGQDVKDFLQEEGFQVQKQYSAFGVSGCAYCPFYEELIYQRVLAVYPDIYEPFIELEKKLGKPAANGKKYLSDIKKNFLENREEIMANFPPLKGAKS